MTAVQITATTDLNQFVGRRIHVTYTITTGAFDREVTIHEVHHGATSTRPELELGDGVRGCATFHSNSGWVLDRSWFYWPYNGLRIEKTGSA